MLTGRPDPFLRRRVPPVDDCETFLRDIFNIVRSILQASRPRNRDRTSGGELVYQRSPVTTIYSRLIYIVFADAPGDVAADQTHVQFVHASPDAPAVDVRVADGGPTLCESIEFRDASEYVPVDAGSYDLEVFPTGSDGVALSLPDTELDGGAAVSAIAAGQAGDGSLGAVFADDTR